MKRLKKIGKGSYPDDSLRAQADDPDATYTSFSNPNYFLNRALHHHDNNNDSAAVNGNTKGCGNADNSDYSSCGPTPTSPDRAMVLNKLNFAPGDSDNDDDDDESAVSDDGETFANANEDSDDDNCSNEESKAPLVGPRKDGGSGADGAEDCGSSERERIKKNRDEPARVYFGVGSRSAKRSRGILGYLEMLEQQALGRAATNAEGNKGGGERKDDRDKEEDEHAAPEVMQGGDQPVEEPPPQEKFDLGTEINSPDSNDSGIQASGEKTPALTPQTPSIAQVPPAMEESQPVEEEKDKEVLPAGWQKHEDEDGPYYWHVKSGTIQRDPPPPAPPDGPALCSPRSVSLTSESSSSSVSSVGSVPSTPGSATSGSGTERHLAEFEGHALQYAAKSLQSLSSNRSDHLSTPSSEQAVRYAVRSLGWVQVAEEDLTPERSSKAVNRCIVDLSLGRNNTIDAVGRWGDALAGVALDRCVAEERKKDLDQQVYVLTTIAKAKSIKQHAIKKAFKRHQSTMGGGLRREGNANWGIKQPPTLLLDACMPVCLLNAMNIGKDLYMDLDHSSLRLVDPVDNTILNSQPIHSIRVWGVGRDNGRDFAYVARDRGSRLHMCHVFQCEVPARQIASSLRDVCKRIMLERSLHQSAVARLSRPTDLPNLDKIGQPGRGTNGERVSLQSIYNNARFPTPMEEPRKVMRCHYLGMHEVMRPTGRDILNEAIQYLYYRVPPEKWKFVNVAIAPSTITITEHGNPDGIIEECRVRFLSFMGIAVDNVKLCAFIMHTSQNKFQCHVFHAEPSAGPICKTIEAACKLRYQKCLDAHPQTPKGNAQGKSVSEVVTAGVKAGVQGLKVGAAEIKTGAVQGVMSMYSLLKGRMGSINAALGSSAKNKDVENQSGSSKPLVVKPEESS
ncbi:amyloid beta a4 precursor protein-binding family b member 2-like [Plakobranchus ocellatus]|uniref:Amyloid beta a4 protein-binding family b member 2-like n=1 Tax=Plakobranchus ocellatus TaxID=259542 RepID=A0AAV4AQU6_9GAST|nr:amyloid beta a4 precursor protein-binding family b member 2-like [Plakobranchus ocellatus]